MVSPALAGWARDTPAENAGYPGLATAPALPPALAKHPRSILVFKRGWLRSDGSDERRFSPGVKISRAGEAGRGSTGFLNTLLSIHPYGHL
jgi:hypothetical protein